MIELHKFEFSVNFSGFRRFRTQQQLNAWRYASIVSDNVVSTSNWSNFWQAFASRGFVSDSWAFLFTQYWNAVESSYFMGSQRSRSLGTKMQKSVLLISSVKVDRFTTNQHWNDRILIIMHISWNVFHQRKHNCFAIFVNICFLTIFFCNKKA